MSFGYPRYPLLTIYVVYGCPLTWCASCEITETRALLTQDLGNLISLILFRQLIRVGSVCTDCHWLLWTLLPWPGKTPRFSNESQNFPGFFMESILGKFCDSLRNSWNRISGKKHSSKYDYLFDFQNSLYLLSAQYNLPR